VIDGPVLPLDLNAFAQSIGRTMTPHAERAGVQMTVLPAAEAPWVKGDRYLLERAVNQPALQCIEGLAARRQVSVEVSQRTRREAQR